MSAIKSFFISLRIFFVLFSLQFVRDAFYRWDGYSYFVKFIDFLPDLSFAFILWTLIGAIIAFLFWIVIYGFSKITLRYLKISIFEKVIVVFVFLMLLYFLKKTFFDISLSDLIGLSYSTFLTGSSILIVFVIWVTAKYINFEKILLGLNIRVSPLVWLFAFLLLLAVPFSIFKSGIADEGHTSSSSQIAVNKNRPNIIFVVMDALTARDMELYGYHRPTTPFISKWAEDAVVFNRMYATSNWTTPATMSIMTGQRPWTHRIWYRAESKSAGYYINNLPMLLKDYGYTVYSFVQNHNAHPETLGITDAFVTKDMAYTFWITRKRWGDKYAEFFTSRHIVAEWVFENNPLVKVLNLKFFRHPIFTSLIRSETVYNRFFEVISQNEKKPFFAWIHVYPPHALYLPPKPYMGMFGNMNKFNTDEKQINSNLIDDYYPRQRQKDVDDLRKRYDESILYSDQKFKEFIKRLSKTVDMSNTIIILMSDHGESFSHGFVGHGEYELFESLVHVPLIIKTPWSARVKTIDMPIEQIDLAPTILELVGITVPEWMEGRSLVSLIGGRMLEPKPIFSMQLIKNRIVGNYPITKGTIAVWSGDHKLIYYLEEKRSLLFDLRADPDETKDISKEKTEIRQRLIELIEDELARVNAKIVQSNGQQ